MGVRYIYLDDNEEEVHIDNPQDGRLGATNNQMELMAVVEGLKQIKFQQFPYYNLIVVITDSRYVSEHIELAKGFWRNNKWLNKEGRPIENVGIWKDLIKVLVESKCSITFKWIKGHSGDEGNTAVHHMAKESARSVIKSGSPLIYTKLRRKITSEKTRIGSIEMKGQRVKIHIINDSYMKEHSLCKYRYEIVSPGSEYFGKVDIIFSKLHNLSSGHWYLVTFNSDTANPRILKVISELENEDKSHLKSKIKKMTIKA